LFNGPETIMYGLKQKYTYQLNLMVPEDGKIKTDSKTTNLLNQLDQLFLKTFTLQEVKNNW